jgi:hypothetical protein
VAANTRHRRPGHPQRQSVIAITVDQIHALFEHRAIPPPPLLSAIQMTEPADALAGLVYSNAFFKAVMDHHPQPLALDLAVGRGGLDGWAIRYLVNYSHCFNSLG